MREVLLWLTYRLTRQVNAMGPPLGAKRTKIDVPVPGLEPGHTASKAAALPITPYRTERIGCQR